MKGAQMATKRKLFEEVGAGQAPVVPQGGLIDGAGKGARRGIRAWLVLIFYTAYSLVFLADK